MPARVVVDPASISDGGELTGADPVTGGGTITWDAADLPGPLAPGGPSTSATQAVLAPSAQLTAAAAGEHRRRSGRTRAWPPAAASTPGRRPRPGSPRSSRAIPTAKAALDPAPAYIGQPFRWRVTVTNTGGATAFGIDVTDTLPAELGVRRRLGPRGRRRRRRRSGRARLVLAATCSGVTSGRSPPASRSSSPTPRCPRARRRQRPRGGRLGAARQHRPRHGRRRLRRARQRHRPYSGPAATASTRIDSADLVLDKTHVEPFVAGADATWRVAVHQRRPGRRGRSLPGHRHPPGRRLAGVRDRHRVVVRGIRRRPRLHAHSSPGETLAVGASLPVDLGRRRHPRRHRAGHHAHQLGHGHRPHLRPGHRQQHRHRHRRRSRHPPTSHRQAPRARPDRRRARRPGPSTSSTTGRRWPGRAPSSPTPCPAGLDLRLGQRHRLVLRAPPASS